jgi:hypothetical protein
VREENTVGYTTVSEVRAAGISVAKASDAAVQAAIGLWSSFIDQQTRQWFEARPGTLSLDGNDSEVLFLSVPVITITGLYINSRFESVDNIPQTNPDGTPNYVVYNARGYFNGTGQAGVDDRKNPKIAFYNQRRSIFQIPSLAYQGRIFMKGHQNQKLVGTFGYTEADGTTPLLIQRACLKLVAKNLAKGVMGDNRLLSGESTDGHSVQYAMPQALGVKGKTFGITGDMEVEQILQMYRAPLAIRAPGSANPLANFELG